MKPWSRPKKVYTRSYHVLKKHLYIHIDVGLCSHPWSLQSGNWRFENKFSHLKSTIRQNSSSLKRTQTDCPLNTKFRFFTNKVLSYSSQFSNISMAKVILRGETHKTINPYHSQPKFSVLGYFMRRNTQNHQSLSLPAKILSIGCFEPYNLPS